MKPCIEVKKKFRINEPNKVIIRDVCEDDSTPKQKQEVSCQNEYQESNQQVLTSLQTNLNQHQGIGNGCAR